MTSRQPPHCAEILSNSDFIQRRAAPIPCVSDVVSDKVCRVPKLTRAVTSSFNLEGLICCCISRNTNCSLGGTSMLAALTVIEVVQVMIPNKVLYEKELNNLVNMICFGLFIRLHIKVT